MRSPEHASHLTLDSLQSTSPFAIADIIIPVYKHRVRSPVYKLWPPERALSVSPLDLFNLNSEPLSHGHAAVNSIPVTESLSASTLHPTKICLESMGPCWNLCAFVHPETVLSLGSLNPGRLRECLQGVTGSWDPQETLASPGWDIFPQGLLPL